jgi:hypothetical protein
MFAERDALRCLIMFTLFCARMEVTTRVMPKMLNTGLNNIRKGEVQDIQKCTNPRKLYTWRIITVETKLSKESEK